MKLVILGAGATRGASFVEQGITDCKPPLDADFFKQMQLIRNPSSSIYIDNIISHVSHLYGPNFNVSLERAFNAFEHSHRLYMLHRQQGQQMSLDAYISLESRGYLIKILRDLFRESLTSNVNGIDFQLLECDYHKSIVQWLNSNDVIVSFNYDCLIDHMLRMYGDYKWNSNYGYRFHISNKATRLNFSKWQSRHPSKKGFKNTVRLYKLHGSMNFDILHNHGDNDYVVNLLAHPYTSTPADETASIIAPALNKQYSVLPYSWLWKNAALDIQKVSEIMVIGYSFPDTDIHSDMLFRLNSFRARGKGLRRLIVVNPDKHARFRARSIFHRCITYKTRVISLDNLSELSSVL